MRYPTSSYIDFSTYTDGELGTNNTEFAEAGGSVIEAIVASASAQLQEGSNGYDSGASYLTTATADFTSGAYQEVELELAAAISATYEGIGPVAHVETADTDNFIGVIYPTSTSAAVVHFTAFTTGDVIATTGAVTLTSGTKIRLAVDLSGGASSAVKLWVGGNLEIDTTYNLSGHSNGQPGVMIYRADNGTMAATNWVASDTSGGIDPSGGSALLLLDS